MAGFFTTLWMRDCGASKTSAFVSGLALSLSGYFMSTISLTISLCTAAYFPLALLTFKRALGTKGFFWKGITAVVLFFQYLAGDPAVFFATVLVYSFFCGYKTIEDSLKSKKFVLRHFYSLMKIGAVLVGLTAFQSFLFAEFLTRSMRQTMPFNIAMMWSVQYNDLIGIVVPFFSDLSMFVMSYWERQSWLENYYVGASVFVLALAAIFSGNKKDIVYYHLLLALFALSLSIGKFSLVYIFLRETFPLLSFVRYPVRFFFLFSFAIACLAGFGLDSLIDWVRTGALKPIAGKNVFFHAGMTLAVAALALFFVLSFNGIEKRVSDYTQVHFADLVRPYYDVHHLGEFAYAALANIERSLIFIALTALGVFSARYLKPRKAVLAIFFMGLVFVDLAAANVIEPRVLAVEISKASAHMKAISKDNGIFRILPSPKTVKQQSFHYGRDFPTELAEQKERLVPNLMMTHGIQDVFGYDSIYVKEPFGIQTALLTLKSPSSPLIDLLNAKYVVTPNEKMPKKYELLGRSKEVNLYLNTKAYPRAFLVREAVWVKDESRLLEKLSSDDFNPEREVFLFGGSRPQEIPPSKRAAGKNEVVITQYGDNEVHMQAWVSDRPWLFFSDTYYPGWKAFVDKKPVEIHKANYAFKAVHLTPGSHEVLWRYDPPLFKLGLAVTVLTCLSLLFYYFNVFKVLKNLGVG